LVLDLLSHTPGITCHAPEGAFYIFASCRDLIGHKTPSGKVIRSDTEFVMYLLDSFRVAVLQGDVYGMSPFFRLSFASSLDVLKEGCRRIQDACGSLE
jgi:aspartate aminotransferase